MQKEIFYHAQRENLLVVHISHSMLSIVLSAISRKIILLKMRLLQKAHSFCGEAIKERSYNF